MLENSQNYSSESKGAIHESPEIYDFQNVLSDVSDYKNLGMKLIK